MLSNLQQAIWITFVGMGLVLGVIVFMWFLLAILVRFTQTQIRKPSETIAIQSQVKNKKKLAAAAAVAFALAHAKKSTYSFYLPPTANVSAWQAVNRTEMLHKHGKIR
jgi:Na+-transporting methylmalonyl-CoA/oxaloacetate decarboxylase gamma subunit